MSLRVLALGTGVCADTPHTKIPRHPPAFLVQTSGLNILLDCSEGVRFRLRNAGVSVSEITHVAVSHAHPDHAALPQFIQTKFCHHLFGSTCSTSASLRIYLPAILARDFPQVWNWHQPENSGKYWDEFAPDIVGMKDGFREELAPGIALSAFSVYHGFGKHPAMGFRLETPDGIVAYTGDSGVCDGVTLLAKDADLLIADCSTRVGQEGTGGYGHMGPRQCGSIAKTANVKRLWLTHYFDFDAPEVLLAEARESGYFGETVVAKDGDEWKK